MKNQVIVSNHDPKFKIRINPVRRIALHALNYLKYTNYCLRVTFTSDAKIRQINRRFLKHNWPTDVLAFSFNGIQPGNIKLLGEVIISPKRAKVQAPHYGASFKEELSRYICHGILHLAGFRDKSKNDQKKIRKAEDVILSHTKSSINRII